jgi:hypothetical protein
LAGIAAALLLFVFGSAATRPHSADPMDRLIQHICADTADHPITVDLMPVVRPFRASVGFGCVTQCPTCAMTAGQERRPPRRFSPGRFARDGRCPYQTVVAANDFDFDYVEPYGAMHPGDGDGFDIYTEYRGKRAADSVYNASLVFVGTSPKVTLEPGATALRLSPCCRARPRATTFLTHGSCHLIADTVFPWSANRSTSR